MLIFNASGMLLVYALQRFQGALPLNPQGMGDVSPDSAFNTAASFATNTNWQGYGGETTMSYLTQMLGLSVQNFLSAATGMAVLLPLIRGFTRKTTASLGNFWVDLTRSTIYVLRVGGAPRFPGGGANSDRLPEGALGRGSGLRQAHPRLRRQAGAR
jgi:K+-transporting ATPase ATPase A chain